MKLGYLAIDQHGATHKLKTNHPRKELMDYLGKRLAQKIYVDTKSGETKHIGYIIGGAWSTVYEIHEWTGVK